MPTLHDVITDPELVRDGISHTLRHFHKINKCNQPTRALGANECVFTDCYFDRAIWDSAAFTSCSFRNCLFVGASFRNSEFRRCDFCRCGLARSDFTAGNSFVDCKITRSDVSNARFRLKSVFDLTFENCVDCTGLQLTGHELLESFPKYFFIGICGSGGFGTVYRAVERRTNGKVALKVFHPDMQGDSEKPITEYFEREISHLFSISSPHVVQALDHDLRGKTKFIVMEFAEGQTLKEMIKNKVPLSDEQLLDISRLALCGLRDIHTTVLPLAGTIVHRDIKPDNIVASMTGSRISLKYIDFGVSRLLKSGRTERGGSFAGSKEYMPPENFRPDIEISVQGDLFSLGATLYHLCTGTLPFPKEPCTWAYEPATRLASFQKPVDFDRVRPLKLRSVLEKCLAVDRRSRPLTAAHALQKLS